MVSGSKCSVQVHIDMGTILLRTMAVLLCALSSRKLSASLLHHNVTLILETPEELQRHLIGQEHGGAHGEASDGIDGRSTEENLQTRTYVPVISMSNLHFV